MTGVLGDIELEGAREELSNPTGETGQRDAFLTLLRSGVDAAVGIALDHYHYADALCRFGGESPFAPYGQETLERARHLLRQPPSPADASPATGAGANHASAMTAMLNLAESQDSELIAHALERTENSHVRTAASMAAKTALRRSESLSLSPRLINSLADVVLDGTLPTADRTEALRAFAYAESPAVVDVLVRAVEQRDLGVQVNAAYVLAEQDVSAHRALLERVVSGWPQDAPYPAGEVRDLLDEVDGC